MIQMQYMCTEFAMFHVDVMNLSLFLFLFFYTYGGVHDTDAMCAYGICDVLNVDVINISLFLFIFFILTLVSMIPMPCLRMEFAMCRMST
jgi:hypothetical protein